MIRNISRVLLISIVVGTISSCSNKREDIAKLTERTTGIEIANDVDIIYSLGGQTKSKITAPLMLRHEERKPYIEFPKSIHADFFDSTLTIVSQLNAHYAKYFESESRILLRDSVMVFNNQGDTLFCKELFWDRNRVGHEFYTDKPVRIRTPYQYIDGDALDAPQDFKAWHIVNARGTVKVLNSEWDSPTDPMNRPDSVDTGRARINFNIPPPVKPAP